MASRRILKKDIIKLTSIRFDLALFMRRFVKAEHVEGVNDFLDDVIVFTDDSLRRAHRPDGADNPQLVRAYYRKLYADIASKLESFDERLDTIAGQLS